MSSIGSSPYQGTFGLPPPSSLQLDEYAAADPARKRLAPKRRFPVFASLSNLRAPSHSGRQEGADRSDDSHAQEQAPETFLPPSTLTADAEDHIELSDDRFPDLPDDGKNHYRWAALFENQRGITLFSTAFYSSSGLLPSDPPPFTTLCTSRSRSRQPALTPSAYPLPDGDWCWVSKRWMIDMRHEGEVQWDGFEYNWSFRQRGWRPHVGMAGSGGLVRRRMWVRLMMKPGRPLKRGGGDGSSSGSIISGLSLVTPDQDSPRPASSIFRWPELTDDFLDLRADDVWKGDDPEEDWERCHFLLRQLGRDGRKMELWKRWLGLEEKGKGKERTVTATKQWSEDEAPLPSEVARTQQGIPPSRGKSPRLTHVTPVLRAHGETILRSFIYPESRAEFLELLAKRGLLSALNIEPCSEIDFWSYVNDLRSAGDVNGNMGSKHVHNGTVRTSDGDEAEGIRTGRGVDKEGG